MKPSLNWIKENIKGVIFDLDGTLVDSMWMWRSIDIEYLQRYGLELPDDYQKCIEGLSFHEVAIYTKNRFSIPDSTEQMKADWNAMAFDYYRNKVALKNGALHFISFLRENGIKIGIATSNSRELLEAVLSSHGILQDFDVIATSSEVTHGKPAPDIYFHVAERMELSPQETLVFEDVEAGILSGKEAGMSVCAVFDSYAMSPLSYLQSISDFYINDFEEIFNDCF